MRPHHTRSISTGSVFTGQIGGHPSIVLESYAPPTYIYQKPLVSTTSNPSIPFVPNTSGEGLWLRVTETPYTGNRVLYLEISSPGRNTYSSSYNLTSSTIYVPISGTTSTNFQDNDILTITFKEGNSSGPVVFTGYAKAYSATMQYSYYDPSYNTKPYFYSPTSQFVHFFKEPINGQWYFEHLLYVPEDFDNCSGGPSIHVENCLTDFSNGYDVSGLYGCSGFNFLFCI